MKADLPYHFCDAAGCDEMIPAGHLYCLAHFRATVIDTDDAFFPDLEAHAEPTPNPEAIPHE